MITTVPKNVNSTSRILIIACNILFVIVKGCINSSKNDDNGSKQLIIINETIIVRY